MSTKIKSSKPIISILLCFMLLLPCSSVLAYAMESDDIIYEDDWYIVESKQLLCVTGRLTDLPKLSFYSVEVVTGGELAFPDELVLEYDVKNIGTISGGTFKGTVTNHGTINGGVFYKAIPESTTINGGTFHGEVKNEVTINGGTFYGALKNHGVINGGTFFGMLENNWIIEGGTFKMLVTNNNTIRNGTFTNTVANNDVINNGTFGFAVHNNAIIFNGKFSIAVMGNAPKSVTHNVNGTDKTFTFGNNILDELGDAGEGCEWFSKDVLVTSGTVPQVYTEYVSKEYNNSTIQGGSNSSADALIKSEIDRIETELNKFDIATVNSDNIDALEQLDEDIDFLLGYNKLAETDKQALETAKNQVSALINAINTPDESTQESTQESMQENTQESMQENTKESDKPDNTVDSQNDGNGYTVIWCVAILCAIAVIVIFIYRKKK